MDTWHMEVKNDRCVAWPANYLVPCLDDQNIIHNATLLEAYERTIERKEHKYQRDDAKTIQYQAKSDRSVNDTIASITHADPSPNLTATSLVTKVKHNTQRSKFKSNGRSGTPHRPAVYDARTTDAT
ncbi:MAG: hypothetical protein J3R72DRAFT_420980 [Linnemannia gamsii]|nr:MAG: hypothetical protein J3R72DRAFT_420980 [Linnemannia gamsii]